MGPAAGDVRQVDAKLTRKPADGRRCRDWHCPVWHGRHGRRFRCCIRPDCDSRCRRCCRRCERRGCGRRRIRFSCLGRGGRIVLDLDKDQKSELEVGDLIEKFHEVAGEAFAVDRMLLEP